MHIKICFFAPNLSWLSLNCCRLAGQINPSAVLGRISFKASPPLLKGAVHDRDDHSVCPRRSCRLPASTHCEGDLDRTERERERKVDEKTGFPVIPHFQGKKWLYARVDGRC